MRKAFAFAGVDENFTSEQFDREWEKSSAKEGDKYQFMEKLIKLPGFRSFDRNFDRLPESMRWMVEKVVHDPETPPAPKPELPDAVRETLARSSARTSPRCRSSPAASSPAGSSTESTGVSSASLPGMPGDYPGRVRIAVAADERVGRRRGGPRGASQARPRADPARRPRRRRARRLGLGERGGRPRRRRGPRRAGDRLLLDRHRRLDRRQQGRRGPRRPLPRRRRPPTARGSGTTPTPSRSACGRPPRPSWPRSSTPGSAARPAATPRTRANVEHLGEIEGGG